MSTRAILDSQIFNEEMGNINFISFPDRYGRNVFMRLENIDCIEEVDSDEGGDDIIISTIGATVYHISQHVRDKIINEISNRYPIIKI